MVIDCNIPSYRDVLINSEPKGIFFVLSEIIHFVNTAVIMQSLVRMIHNVHVPDKDNYKYWR